jgi:integrase
MAGDITPRTAALPPNMDPVAELVGESLAPATRRAYRCGIAAFRAYCDDQGISALPAEPETVAAFLAAGAAGGSSVSTLAQRVAAIRWAHEAAGLESPTAAKLVRSTMQGIRRRLGVAPTRKAPATVERISAMLAGIDRSTTKGKRDAALLLVGFATALRRSELVALDLADIEATDRGLLVTVRRSKTDQEGVGHLRAILPGQRDEHCPIRALNEWLESGGISSGRIFRAVNRHGRVADSLSTHAVGELVKQAAKRAGLDPADFAAHSLRAGFVTSAAERGASAERIMDHTGHQSAAMVRVYTRRADAFADHAGQGLL